MIGEKSGAEMDKGFDRVTRSIIGVRNKSKEKWMAYSSVPIIRKAPVP